MKNVWQMRTLGDVVQLISGQHIEAKNYNAASRGIAYLTGPSDFGPVYPIISKWTEHPKVTAKRGDILVTVKGSGVGKINLMDEAEAAISRQLMAVRVTGADPRFIYHLLGSTFDHFQAESTGAAIPGISRDQVLGLKLALPPLTEQQRIVGILDEAFEGIATAKANAEKNFQNARALFESHLHAVFTQQGEEWEHRRLGDICAIARGGSPRPIQKFLTTAESGVNWIKISDATSSGKYIYQTEQKIIPEGAKRSRVVNPGDFLLSNSMSFGRPYIMRTTGCIHDGWLVLSDYSTHLDQDYLYLVLGSDFVFQQFDRLAAGSTVRNLNIELASRVVIPVPSLASQRAIAASLDRLHEEVEHLESIYQQKLRALDELKKSLLHQAFSGNL